MNLIPFQNLVSGNHAKITNYAILSLDLFKVTSNSSIEWQHNNLQVSRVGVYSLCIERVPLKIFQFNFTEYLASIRIDSYAITCAWFIFYQQINLFDLLRKQIRQDVQSYSIFLKRVIMWQKLLRFDRLCGVIY